jgi:hypothetical protein
MGDRQKASRKIELIRNYANDPRLAAVSGVLEMLTDEGGRIFSSLRLREISEKILFWIDEVEK